MPSLRAKEARTVTMKTKRTITLDPVVDAEVFAAVQRRQETYSSFAERAMRDALRVEPAPAPAPAPAGVS